ncbi:MAG: hypothetical protein GY953_28335, partial [bacterium]|nr:hypothetical protein [bacterium]
WEILSTRFNGNSEDGSVTIRLFNLDNNRGPRGDVIDNGEEVFDAFINVRLAPDAARAAVTDCTAFSTCP